MSAHPGIGLVYDGHRYIYYTDLAHVWKLDTESGISEIAVKDVHSHELVLDQYGTLYGEHYWYDETEKTFKNYIWQLGSQGEFKIIRDTIKGENEDFGFVRDSVFGSYELEINQDQYSIVRSDSLSKKILHSAQLQNPGWLYLSKNDELYFTDVGSVYRYYKGDLINVASNLASSRFPFSLQANGHNLYGIWKDFDHNV